MPNDLAVSAAAVSVDPKENTEPELGVGTVTDSGAGAGEGILLNNAEFCFSVAGVVGMGLKLNLAGVFCCCALKPKLNGGLATSFCSLMEPGSKSALEGSAVVARAAGG